MQPGGHHGGLGRSLNQEPGQLSSGLSLITCELDDRRALLSLLLLPPKMVT